MILKPMLIISCNEELLYYSTIFLKLSQINLF